MAADTTTPLDLLLLPSKDALLKAFKGKSLDSLRTPAAIIDRGVYQRNCERVVSEAKRRGMSFRAHIKTHKTLEGTRMQCESAGGVSRIICSTLVEVHQVVVGGLVDEGLVDDILYSMPIGADRIHDLATLQTQIGSKGVIRVMVDHPSQVIALDQYNTRAGRSLAWGVFVKVDGGGRRAGVPPESEQMKELLQTIKSAKAVEIFGFYSHFGHSYGAESLDSATDYFHAEVECANSAALFARQLGMEGDWTLSVGATPTAHAATSGPVQLDNLEGSLELHAGNYCVTDLQQYATSLVSSTHLALTVLASVLSRYPHRSEALCDAGGLSVSKDTGPIAGYGDVISPNGYGWRLGKVSQEHGILVRRQPDDRGVQLDGVETVRDLTVGDRVRIVPQHACLILAAQPWVYVVDGGDEVVDVWVPWKGW